MGWTWSLAIQGQFYLLFPILLRYSKQSSRLLRWMIIGVLIVTVCRIISTTVFFSVFTSKLSSYFKYKEELTNMYIWFMFFYMPAYQRFGVIFIGVILSYIQVQATTDPTSRSAKCLVRIKESLFYYSLCLAFSFSVFYCHIYGLGQNVSSAYMMLVLLGIGGPFFGIAVSVLLFLLLNSSPNSIVRRFFSLRLWDPLSKLSYIVYLIHSSYIQKFYSTIFLRPSHSVFVFWSVYVPINLFASFGTAFILYIILEKPAATFFGQFGSRSISQKRD